MRFIVLFILMFITNSFCVGTMHFNNIYQDSAILTAGQLNEDNDSTSYWSDRIRDTLNYVVPRNNTIRTLLKDSTFQKIKVDTIKSNPYIDSIQGDIIITGNPIATGNVRGDSIYSTKGVTSGAGIKGTIGTFSSTVSVDSLYSAKGVTSAAGLKGTTGTFSSTITVDSLSSTKGIAATVGNLSSYLNVDSINSTKKIKTTGINSSGDISGTTGTYSSTVSVDSLKSTKGVAATVGNFSSYINSDSLCTVKGIKGTVGNLSSYLNADSICTVKGIKGTVGNFSSYINIDSLNSTKKLRSAGLVSSGNISTDSLYSTKGITSGAGIKGTIGTFSSTVNANSLKLTKGISATNGNFTNNVLVGTELDFKSDSVTSYIVGGVNVLAPFYSITPYYKPNYNGGFLNFQTRIPNSSDTDATYSSSIIFSTSDTGRLYISRHGNIGIGTHTVPQKLTVNGNMSCDSIKTGSDWFKYETGTFACTVKVEMGGFTAENIKNGYYTKIGNIVHVRIEKALYGALYNSTAVNYILMYGFPSTFKTKATNIVTSVIDNGTAVPGLIIWVAESSGILFSKYDASNFNISSSGISSSTSDCHFSFMLY